MIRPGMTTAVLHTGRMMTARKHPWKMEIEIACIPPTLRRVMQSHIDIGATPGERGQGRFRIIGYPEDLCLAGRGPASLLPRDVTYSSCGSQAMVAGRPARRGEQEGARCLPRRPRARCQAKKGDGTG